MKTTLAGERLLPAKPGANAGTMREALSPRGSAPRFDDVLSDVKGAAGRAQKARAAADRPPVDPPARFPAASETDIPRSSAKEKGKARASDPLDLSQALVQVPQSDPARADFQLPIVPVPPAGTVATPATSPLRPREGATVPRQAMPIADLDTKGPRIPDLRIPNLRTPDLPAPVLPATPDAAPALKVERAAGEAGLHKTVVAAPVAGTASAPAHQPVAHEESAPQRSPMPAPLLSPKAAPAAIGGGALRGGALDGGSVASVTATAKPVAGSAADAGAAQRSAERRDASPRAPSAMLPTTPGRESAVPAFGARAPADSGAARGQVAASDNTRSQGAATDIVPPLAAPPRLASRRVERPSAPASQAPTASTRGEEPGYSAALARGGGAPQPVVSRETHFRPLQAPAERRVPPPPFSEASAHGESRPRASAITAPAPDMREAAPAPRADAALKPSPSPSPAPPFQQIAAAIGSELGDAAPDVLAAPANVAAPLPGNERHEPLKLIKVALDPPELGRVTVALRLSGRTLEVSVTAERPETAASLDRDKHLLARIVHASGYRVEDVTIRAQAPGVSAPAAEPRGAPVDSGSQATPQFTSSASAEGERRAPSTPRGEAQRAPQENQGDEADRHPGRAGGLYV